MTAEVERAVEDRLRQEVAGLGEEVLIVLELHVKNGGVERVHTLSLIHI